MLTKLRVFGAMLLLAFSAASSASEQAPPPFWLHVDEPVQLIPETPKQKFLPESIGKPLEGFQQYADRAVPKVPSRKKHMTLYPCSNCHQALPPNPQPRELMPVHEVGLQHGEGRIWCTTCHDLEDRNFLTTVRGEKVDFDESWKVCGQCHSARQRDWYYGAHGKRVYNWKGEAERYNCTHCHNPHRPPFMERKPQPVPPVRAGLEPMKPKEGHHKLKVWERHQEGNNEH